MVVFPEVQILDVTGPLEVFARTARWLVDRGRCHRPAYTVELLAARHGIYFGEAVGRATARHMETRGEPGDARHNADPSVICIGSTCTTNLASSLVDAYYETDKTAQIVLEHQSGNNPEQIYLRVFIQNSKWHAMARINIRRL